MWIILPVGAGLGILYWVYGTYHKRRAQRTMEQRATERATAGVPLRRLRAPSPGSQSTASAPAPRYEGHVDDVSVPDNVKLEQRGKYHYLGKEERAPTYQG